MPNEKWTVSWTYWLDGQICDCKYPKPFKDLKKAVQLMERSYAQRDTITAWVLHYDEEGKKSVAAARSETETLEDFQHRIA